MDKKSEVNKAVEKLSEILINAYEATCDECKHKGNCNEKNDSKRCLWETKDDYDNHTGSKFSNNLNKQLNA